MLKIGVTYSSTAETLANLGLPPNRKPGNMGFMVHETDGKFHPAAQGGCGHIHAGEWEEKVEDVKVLTMKSAKNAGDALEETSWRTL